MREKSGFAKAFFFGGAILLLAVLAVVARCTTEEFGVPADAPAAGGSPPADDAAVQRWIEIARGGDDDGLLPGNDVRLLVNGEETYDAMLTSIGSARRHIHVETFIIENDQAGNRIADALIERARAGVRVRFIYDGLGSSDSNSFWKRLRDAGVDVHEFNPPEPTENVDVPEYDRRDHRKLLIVDGRVGFTGGVNFYDAYSNDSSTVTERGLADRIPWLGSGNDELLWRDTHVRIEGPAVAALQRIFVAFWEELEGKTADPSLYPDLDVEGPHHVGFEVGVGGNAKPSETYAAYLDVFENAQHRIWITQAYFVPDARFLRAMARAARRGVDVKVIVPGVTDVSFILYASRQLYGELLESGVQIFEYQDAVLHAKTAVVDGAWSIVGSSNLDALSFLRNHEVDAIVVGRDFAGEMERLFLDDLAETRQVTLEEWQGRPLGYRVLGWVAGWFEPWM